MQNFGYTAADASCNGMKKALNVENEVLSLLDPLNAEEILASNKDRISLTFQKPEGEPDGEGYGRFSNHFSSKAIKQPLVERILEMSEIGYVLSATTPRGRNLVAIFDKNSNIYASNKKPNQPQWISTHKTQLDSFRKRFPIERNSFEPIVESEQLPYKPSEQILSKKTIDQFEPKKYAFVLLRGENFLRLADSHYEAGAWEDAITAGDIKITRQDGKNTVEIINNRSGTYLTYIGNIAHAVEALWRQGIFPDTLIINARKRDNLENPVQVLHKYW